MMSAISSWESVEQVNIYSEEYSTYGRPPAYSATAGTSTTLPILMPQWQTKTPIRGGSPDMSRSCGNDAAAVSEWRDSFNSSPAWAARARSLHDRVRNIARRLKDSAGVNAVAVGQQRVEALVSGKAEAVGFHAQGPGQGGRVRIRRQAHGEHDHIEGFHLEVVFFVEILNFQIARFRAFNNPGRHGPDKPDPAFVPRPFVVPVEPLALGPHVHVKDGFVPHRRACSPAMTACLAAYMQQT